MELDQAAFKRIQEYSERGPSPAQQAQEDHERALDQHKMEIARPEGLIAGLSGEEIQLHPWQESIVQHLLLQPKPSKVPQMFTDQEIDFAKQRRELDEQHRLMIEMQKVSSGIIGLPSSIQGQAFGRTAVDMSWEHQEHKRLAEMQRTCPGIFGDIVNLQDKIFDEPEGSGTERMTTAFERFRQSLIDAGVPDDEERPEARLKGREAVMEPIQQWTTTSGR